MCYLWRNITIMIDSLLEATFNSNLFDQVAKIRCSIFGIKINITRSVPEREKKSRLIQLLSTVYQQIKKSKTNDQSRNRVWKNKFALQFSISFSILKRSFEFCHANSSCWFFPLDTEICWLCSGAPSRQRRRAEHPNIVEFGDPSSYK